ncbi:MULTISPECIES: DUF1127 domain-containing protein [Dickeya]|uniref:YjiS-like domain-containing protein n=1 Tax=Dickeya aquatica TaxID=1401087 RepID=A0A375A5R8_9GAMM|nr:MULTISPECIES: DUF1127 domain-containing protein [Dickeya]SLM61412.1 hypothetical protein DAQ1742_00297 [Dickeya aquatica]
MTPPCSQPGRKPGRLQRVQQCWQRWRQRVQARKILQRLNNNQLDDIGLTRHDVDSFR